MEFEDNLLSLGKYRIRKKLEDAGLKWIDDKEGKVRVWIRLNKDEKGRIFEPVFEKKGKVLSYNFQTSTSELRK